MDERIKSPLLRLEKRSKSSIKPVYAWMIRLGSILVALNMGSLTLAEERDPARTELLRRLFDVERANTQIHA